MQVALTPVDWLRRAVKLYPAKVAVIDENVRFTYRQFGARVNRLSHALRRAGVENGSKVAVLCPNTHPMLEAFFGICQLGAAIVPINIRLQAEEIAYILDHSDAEVLIVDSEWGSVVDPILSSLPQLHTVIQVNRGHSSPLQAVDYEEVLAAAPDDPIAIDLDENQPLSINYTSGTTSRPKGVVLTHRNSYLNAANFLFHLRVEHDDVYLHTLPLFHVNGWGGVWALTAVGGTHVCLRKVDPAVILRLFTEEGVTLACAAPTVVNMLVQHPGVESIRIPHRTRMATAGSPPPAAVIEKAERYLNMEIIHVYGLTETAPFITYCEWTRDKEVLDEDARARAKARQGVEMIFAGDVRVVHDDGSEVAWNGMDIGEIVARGNVVMDGYYKNPEDTAKAVRDGWFHTGDLAVVHPDGHIEIVDRLKDVIISGGENVSSVEVEGVLYQHPGVLEAGVVARPDERWGEVPVAFVVRKPGANVTEDELNAFCRARLAHFKVPKAYHFVDELPRTGTGKLQKFKLREMLWAGMDKRVH
ncbi:long-chain-fatty-acid--CoA ligase [Alicyclobacillus vulcanalis]|uniref:Fatty-acyl-CoA synthase n=1 Tax=Alicyclobacillus vulcanalis TaxID=252246 RepID=A0A1N7LKY9_9BACL|nr:long-chain-fatty-acid--CoA ligase [Alicyclobacillus vulcanalis]SIS74486.1 fatty-acyl-CoA synthase [Alicyclobacillus vulcanalis]